MTFYFYFTFVGIKLGKAELAAFIQPHDFMQRLELKF